MYYIGIDVAKSTLQVFIPKNELNVEYENSYKGFKSLYSKLKKLYKKSIDDIVFIYESTGSYSTILESFAQKYNIKCFKVGAMQSSSFSKVVKHRSKTDKLDAKMLHQMHILAKEDDIKVPYRDEDAHKIRSLIKYYQSLVKEQKRKNSYLEASTYNLEDSLVLKRVKKRIKAIEKEQVEIIDAIMDVINSNPKYKQAYDNITTIKGVGQKSGIMGLFKILCQPDIIREEKEDANE